MRNYVFIVVCALAIVGCKQKQGQTAADTAETDSVQTEVIGDNKIFTPAEIGSQWTSKDIPVAKGGQQPDIVTLLKAFAQVWPTEAVSALLGIAVEEGDEYDRVGNVVRLNPDTGGGMEINYKNGYASVQPGDTDEDCLFAAVWKRTDGHRLLAIWLYTPSADNRSKPDGKVLCFYDYDPKTETMTPEKDNAVTRFQPSKDCYVEISLPARDRDVMVGETDSKYETRWHVFAFDGMNFKEETAYTHDELLQAAVGLWKNADQKLPFTFRISLDEDDWPQVADCAISGNTEWEVRASVLDGRIYVIEYNPKNYDEEEESSSESSLVCSFRLTKDGRLKGGCHMKQKDGKEFNGILTLKKQSQLNDYAE